MKIPQFITAYRAITVGITLVIMALVLLGDVLGPLSALLKGI
ncbi:MAG: hypothetical protein JWM19_1032 [Actinomycetia bacterium]|nr:hypothetical protein [Actinomycetes bacterium]